MTRRLKLSAFLLAVLFAAFAPAHAFAQSINFDMGQGPSATAHMVQTVMLITVFR